MMQVIKRDGKYAPFNKEKIKNAVYKALAASGLPSESVADKVTGDVVEKLDKLEDGKCAPHRIPQAVWNADAPMANQKPWIISVRLMLRRRIADTSPHIWAYD